MGLLSRLASWFKRSNIAQLARLDDAPERSCAGLYRLAKVVDVYDGDTITVIMQMIDGEQYYKYKVRLNGIDTPELRTSNALEKHAAHIVRDVLRAKINGTIVSLNLKGEDKYGRLLADVYDTNAIDICQWLIDAKYALPYKGGTKVSFTQDFLNNIVQ